MSSSVLQVVDANDVTQNICVASPDTPTDRSGTYNGATQIVLDTVPAGFQRGAWMFQNRSRSGTTVQINEIGGDADASPTCFDVPPGGVFPPPGYPVTQAQVSVIGVNGEQFACREWLVPIEND